MWERGQPALGRGPREAVCGQRAGLPVEEQPTPLKMSEEQLAAEVRRGQPGLGPCPEGRCAAGVPGDSCKSSGHAARSPWWRCALGVRRKQVAGRSPGPVRRSDGVEIGRRGRFGAAAGVTALVHGRGQG